MSGAERIRRFIADIPRHDGSVALAVLELLRVADDGGVAERSDWVTAVRTAQARFFPDRAVIGPGSTDETDSSQQVARYLGDHVLSRTAQADIASAEPEGADAWQRVRIDHGIWHDVALVREAFVADLEETVRILLGEDGRQPVQARPEDAPRRRTDSTLRAESLVKVYRKRKVVNEVTIKVSQGEIVGLLGPNGAGKTTTFYMMVGLIRPDRGRVFLDDRELTETPMYRRAQVGVGYLAQEPSIFRKLTVEDNILAILETMGLPRKERLARLERLLGELGLKPLRKSKAYSLSGGERRRLEITRALVSRPKFMLLDEPFAGVDPIAVHDIQQIVADLRHRGIGVIISDHNVEQTLEIVDRAYIMYDGRVRVSGTVAELVWNDDVAEIYFGPTLTGRMRGRYLKPEMV
ncbi:MAG TPA: LPS export ABC transporter ATP-binding protein [Longimicrobiales bacterium]|nr:LPS export ABC transporter ATP-binding protein [Longimicrobiales bacterium]